MTHRQRPSSQPMRSRRRIPLASLLSLLCAGALLLESEYLWSLFWFLLSLAFLASFIGQSGRDALILRILSWVLLVGAAVVLIFEFGIL